MRRVREERVSGPLAAAGRRAGVKGRGGGGAAPSAVPWSAGWGGVPTRGAEFFDSETRDPESSPSGGTEGHFSLRAAPLAGPGCRGGSGTRKFLGKSDEEG